MTTIKDPSKHSMDVEDPVTTIEKRQRAFAQAGKTYFISTIRGRNSLIEINFLAIDPEFSAYYADPELGQEKT